MSNYWTGKRVIVTGGAGFLGSHVVELLLVNGAEVLVLDNGERGRNFIEGANYTHCFANDQIGMMFYSKKFNVDIVMNLAASVAGVLYNQTHNILMFIQNAELQSIPVLICSELQIPRFIQISSVCVYAPEYAEGALEENGQLSEPVEANSGYSWAKRMGERVALWSDLLNVSIVRPSNLFGPRDYFDDRAHVIPALIKKCLHDDVIKVHGTGQEVREFLYVEDAARGLLAAAEHGKHREVYNLGTHGRTAVTIADLVTEIQTVTDTTHKPVEFIGGDAGDKARWSYCVKAENELGWRSLIGLRQGLINTVEWYHKYIIDQELHEAVTA